MMLSGKATGRRQRFSVGQYTQTAKQTLFFRSNWISSLLTCFSVLLFTSAAAFFVRCLFEAMTFSGFADENYIWLDTLYAILGVCFLFFLLSPLYTGCLVYFYDLHRSVTENSERILPAEIFSMYTSLENIIRTWRILCLRLLFCCPIPVSLILCNYGFRAFRAGLGQTDTRQTAVSFVFLTASAVLLLCSLFFAIQSHPLVFLGITRPELPVSACVRRSFAVMRHSTKPYLLLILYFIPFLLLSLLTGLILFFVYLLPWMLFSDLIFCERILTTPAEMTVGTHRSSQ